MWVLFEGYIPAAPEYSEKDSRPCFECRHQRPTLCGIRRRTYHAMEPNSSGTCRGWLSDGSVLQESELFRPIRLGGFRPIARPGGGYETRAGHLHQQWRHWPTRSGEPSGQRLEQPQKGHSSCHRTFWKKKKPQEAQEAHVEIRIDDLSGPEIAELLREHLANMAENSPPE